MAVDGSDACSIHFGCSGWRKVGSFSILSAVFCISATSPSILVTLDCLSVKSSSFTAISSVRLLLEAWANMGAIVVDFAVILSVLDDILSIHERGEAACGLKPTCIFELCSNRMQRYGFAGRAGDRRLHPRSIHDSSLDASSRRFNAPFWLEAFANTFSKSESE